MGWMSAENQANTVNSLFISVAEQPGGSNQDSHWLGAALPLAHDSISESGNRDVSIHLDKMAELLPSPEPRFPALESDVMAILAPLLSAISNTDEKASYQANDPTTQQVFQNTKIESQLSNQMNALQDQQQKDLDQGDAVAAQNIEKTIELLQKLQDAFLFITNLDLQHIMKTQGASAENAVEHEGNAISEQDSGQDLFNYDQSAAGFASVEADQLLGVLSPD